jgi:sugar phosphate isomerase/epimerase
MHIGILTNTFDTTTVDDTVAALKRHGIAHIQLELPSIGLDPLPAVFDPATATRIGQRFVEAGIVVAAVSGTFNMIHPDPAHRADGLRRLGVMASMCELLGTRTITLCSGTRDTTSMWRWHADSYTDDAWRDLISSMTAAARIGERLGVTMAFEPEVNNSVDSAKKARRLLDAVGSPHLKVVMDGANVFHAGELPRMREVLEETFALLGNDIALAHAKDLDHDGDAGHLPAGQGLLDYGLYISLLKRAGFDGALVLHGLRETDVAGCVAFLQKHLAS